MKARNIVRGQFGLPRATTLTQRDLGAALALGAFIALVGNWLLTAWFADQLGHRPVLGEPWFFLAGRPMYAPWAWLVWRARVAAYYPNAELVTYSAAAAGVIAAGSVLAAALALLARSRKNSNRKDELYGSAHWATPAEVKKTHLLGRKAGLFVGSWFDPDKRMLRYLRHNGPEHVIGIAPTRSGKDVGLAIPTLLTFAGSAVVLDPKGEAWNKTAGYLHSVGHRVIRYEPSAPPALTAHHNPLAEVRLGTHHERADAQDIATSWLNADGKRFEGDNAIWAQAARPLMAAAILHVLYREQVLGRPTARLEQVFYELVNPQKPFDEVLNEWLEFAHDPTARRWNMPNGEPSKTHPMVASVAMNLLGLAQETRASILLSAQAALEILYDDCLAANLADSDFRLTDIANGDRPTTLYLVYPPPVVDRLAPVLRTTLELLIQRLTERLDFKNGRPQSSHAHRVLLLANEFPRVGRLRAVENALPICAAYGVTAFLFTQDLQQLRAVYGGADETITANCRVRVFYAPNKPETAKVLSEMLGRTTALKTAESSSSDARTTSAGARRSRSEHEVGRDLLMPDELMRLPAAERDEDDQAVIGAPDIIVSKTGYAPIYGKGILYWEDPELLKRARMPPPEPRAHLGALSTTRAVVASHAPRTTPPARSAPTAPPTHDRRTRTLRMVSTPWGSTWESVPTTAPDEASPSVPAGSDAQRASRVSDETAASPASVPAAAPAPDTLSKPEHADVPLPPADVDETPAELDQESLDQALAEFEDLAG